MDLKEIKEKIKHFEEEYDMKSKDFEEKFQSGELGDAKKFMKWDMLLDARKELEQNN